MSDVLVGRSPDSERLGAVRRAYELAVGLNDTKTAAAALAREAAIQTRLGNTDKAAATAARANDLLGDSEQFETRAIIQRTQAHVAFSRGRLGEAATCYQKTVDLYRRIGNRRFEAVMLSNLAVVERHLSRLEQAYGHHRRALHIIRELGFRQHQGVQLAQMAMMFADFGRLGEANRCLERALELHKATGNRQSEALCYQQLGDIALYGNRLNKAEALFRKAIVEMMQLGLPKREALIHADLSIVAILKGEFSVAAQQIERALTCEALSRRARSLGVLLGILAIVEAAEGQLNVADVSLEKARGLLDAEAYPREYRVLEMYGAFVELKRSEAADSNDAAQKARLKAKAQITALLTNGPSNALFPWGQPSSAQGAAELRLALSVVEQALNEDERDWVCALALEGAQRALICARNGASFRPPGGSVVDLSTRRPLRRILAHLISCRVGAPAQGVPTAELLICGWPDEVVSPSSGARRVHVAIRSLREMGLATSLKTGDSGYTIAPELPLMLVRRCMIVPCV